ncbi:MAG: sigma-54-dependent Fis family transcriptional regulator [Deltaproteobacteria bacterium]|nr:sigma-54-dependent Fis family transcriptional regulator [Deltaproteobacteria bacterium]
MLPSVLIVDDEASIRQSLSGILADEGFDVITAANGYEALKIVESDSPDIVLLDIWMQGIDGIETLKAIKKDNPFIPVILISGHGNIEMAVKATKMGAFDLIEKPLSIDKVILTINHALNVKRLEEENRYLRKKTIEKHSITGTSPLIQDLKKQITQAAPTDAWILIVGENGTGKELVARTIHNLSDRADQVLVDVNCAAIPDSLIESELFGHEKGTLSDTSGKKRGKFEIANNGTLFFDEIADMNLSTQAKILRVLQEQQFQRLGGTRTIQVDLRVIAATNKDLEAQITQGAFREDLYYRLNVIPIHVPPLRERREDIPMLVDTFLAEFAQQNRSKPKQISKNALDYLLAYQWPGNVRELRNLIERLSIMGDKDEISNSDIPAPYNPDNAGGYRNCQPDLFELDNLKTARKAFEDAFILQKFAAHDNDIDRTSAIVGLSQETLRKKLKQLKSDIP